MVGIVDGTVVALHIGHQVFVQVEAEHVTEHATHTTRAGLGRQQFGGIAIRQHHDHLFGLAFSQQVVEDIVHTTNLIIHFLGIRCTTDQIEHRIFLVLVLLVLRGQIDDGLVRGTQTLGVIVDILQLAVGHVLDVVGQSVLARNLQQTVLETLVGEVLRVLGIHHADTVDDVAIGVHVRSHRTEGNSPKALFVTLHGITPCKLHVDQHLLGLIVLVVKGYSAVGITNG